MAAAGFYLLAKTRELAMSIDTRRFHLLLGIALLTLAQVGCGSGNFGTVSGSVTYNGTPIEKGTISFYPVDGNSPTAGGEIANGKYKVSQLTPGRKRVQVTVQPTPDAGAARAKTREGAEAQRHNREAAATVKKAIPDDVQGNNEQMEVVPGSQTYDVKLTGQS
jgi:hypothetical protein